MQRKVEYKYQEERMSVGYIFKNMGGSLPDCRFYKTTRRG